MQAENISRNRRPTGQRPFLYRCRDTVLYAVFVFTFASGIFMRGDSAQLLSSSGNNLDQVFWLLAFLVSAVIALRSKLTFLHILRPITWLLPLMAWILVSTLWSAHPELTLRRAAREEIEILSITLLVLTYSTPSEPFRVIFASFLTVLFIDLASLLSSSSWSRGQFVGIHGQKNVTGGFYFVAVPLFVAALFDRKLTRARYVSAFAVVTGAALLWVSGSKTSIGLFALVVPSVLAVNALRGTGKYSGVLAFTYMLTIASLGVVVFQFGVAGSIAYLTGDPTFTGRVQVWQYVLSRWGENPYFGLGFGALWQVGSQIKNHLENQQIVWVMNEAHNGYLDVLAQTGIIGLFLLIAFLFSAVGTLLTSGIRRSADRNLWGLYGLYVVIGILLYNITETTLLKPGAGHWLLLVGAYVAAHLGKVTVVHSRPPRTLGRQEKPIVPARSAGALFS